MKLTETKVVFDAVSHRYYLGSKELKGITGIINDKLFPEKYKNIPDAVLQKAAADGTRVHHACEVYDTLGISTDDCPELASYKAILGRLPSHLATEYLVSDEAEYASAIDKVYEAGESDVVIGDIKHTYRLDEESVSWQLSVYKYLFERQNPNINVKAGYAIWLRGKESKLVPVAFKTKEEVEWLLYDKGEIQPKREITEIADVEAEIIDIEAKLAEMKAKEQELKSGLEAIMREKGVKFYKSDRIILTIKSDQTRESFDTKKLKEEQPEVFAKYLKQTEVKGGLTIKIK